MLRGRGAFWDCSSCLGLPTPFILRRAMGIRVAKKSKVKYEELEVGNFIVHTMTKTGKTTSVKGMYPNVKTAVKGLRNIIEERDSKLGIGIHSNPHTYIISKVVGPTTAPIFEFFYGLPANSIANNLYDLKTGEMVFWDEDIY